MHSRQGYYPYGETRYATGELPTDFHFTGQRNDATIGLYDYHARFYDPYLNRFISADTIIPNPAAPQSFNRYAYVLGNPLKYTDPTGHQCQSWDDEYCSDEPPPPSLKWYQWVQMEMKRNWEGRVRVQRWAKPGLKVGRTEETVSKLMSYAQLALDAWESYVSVTGNAGSAAIATLTGGTGGAVSQAVLDFIETRIGDLDLVLNYAADSFAGETYALRSKESYEIEWVLGQDTLVTSVEQGADSIIPLAAADIPINALATAYDIVRTFMDFPSYIELHTFWELRVSNSSDDSQVRVSALVPLHLTDWYFVIYPDAGIVND